MIGTLISTNSSLRLFASAFVSFETSLVGDPDPALRLIEYTSAEIASRFAPETWIHASMLRLSTRPAPRNFTKRLLTTNAGRKLHPEKGEKGELV